MSFNFKYRLYGRSKGRNKNKNINSYAKKILVTKIDRVKFNIVDIGAGYGESTLYLARKYPENSIIACEKYIDGINKIAESSNRFTLNNISIYYGNAKQFFDENCSVNSISEIWILFPDPWPKKRHHKRRLINVNFLKNIEKYIKKGSFIHIASDSKSYILQILNSIYFLKKDYKWINQNRDEWNYNNLNLPQTKYLKKAQEKGLSPFYCKLKKL